VVRRTRVCHRRADAPAVNAMSPGGRCSDTEGGGSPLYGSRSASRNRRNSTSEIAVPPISLNTAADTSAVATCGIFGQSLLECRQFEVEGIPPSCHRKSLPQCRLLGTAGAGLAARMAAEGRVSAIASFTPHPKQPARPNKRTGGLALALVHYGMMISTTLRRSAIHAADQLPDLELVAAAAAHRWDHPEDRAAAR
jgi:hypothetical protein